MTSDDTTFSLPPRIRRALALAALAGGLVTLAGILWAPRQTWPALLLAALYVLGLGLGGLLFIALHHVTRAGWSTVVRRVPEAMAGTLPVGAGLLALALLGGLRVLYPWSRSEAAGSHGTGLGVWFAPGFFYLRAAVYVGTWLTFAWALRRVSRRQEARGVADDAAAARGNAAALRLSAGFLVACAVTLSLASFDWLMALEPRWASTMFGVYAFAGILQSALAAVTLLVLLLHGAGAFRRTLTAAHIHDLGKYVFAFSVFWAYIWFSQYMLIWYANLPEETGYLVRRQASNWLALLIANLVLNFGVPFLVLLPRPAKRNPRVLALVCWVVLVGHWLDLYTLVFPPFLGAGPWLSLWQLAPTVAGLALFGLMFLSGLGRAALLPVGDPFLAESLHHH